VYPGDWLSKTGVLGRVALLAVVAGVLAAATILPIVAATGITVRNAANSFTTLKLDAGSLPQRSEILDAQGHLITYVYGVDLGQKMTYSGINRQPVGYNQISPNMLKAIVAIEDNRFWTRGALDIKGTMRALVNDLEHKPIQGASTIEQQYVKGVLVLQGLGSASAEQAATADTVGRKIDQLRMAVDVAHTMSKQQIGRRDVLRHHRGQAHADAGGHAGRHRGGPLPLRSAGQPAAVPGTAQHGAGPDDADGSALPRRGDRGDAARQ
jgi:membrane peptidoglycan carboxypeptidase